MFIRNPCCLIGAKPYMITRKLCGPLLASTKERIDLRPPLVLRSLRFAPVLLILRKVPALPQRRPKAPTQRRNLGPNLPPRIFYLTRLQKCYLRNRLTLPFTKPNPPFGRVTTQVRSACKFVNRPQWLFGTPVKRDRPLRIILLRETGSTKPLPKVHTNEKATRPKPLPWNKGLTLKKCKALPTYFTPYPQPNLSLFVLTGPAMPV